MADSIRISQLDLIDEITIDDRIVINNENVNTNAIKFSNFINSIETYPLLTFEGTVIFNGAVQLPEALNIQMSLAGLTDVNISDTQPDQILKWTGTTWANAANDALQVTGISVTTAPVPVGGGSLVYGDNGNFVFTPADVPVDYTLPTAGANTLGGVKVGDRLSITADGVLSANVQTPPVASNSSSGTVIVGQYLQMSTQGVLSVDDVTLAESNNITKIASPTELGQVKVGDNLTISNQGVLDVDLAGITAGAGYATQEWVGDNYVSEVDLNATLANYTDTVTMNAALGMKADLASPTFTGLVQAPTPADNSTSTAVATTGFVTTAVANASTDYAPAAVLNDAALTGAPTAPTVADNSVTTAVATTGYVHMTLADTANAPDLRTALGIKSGTDQANASAAAGEVWYNTASGLYLVGV